MPNGPPFFNYSSTYNKRVIIDLDGPNFNGYLSKIEVALLAAIKIMNKRAITFILVFSY